jgi:TonB-linked SusC/RagA family outer membrane protein
MTLAQAASPQEGKLNLNLGKTTFKEVFAEIQKQTGYIVMYNNAMLDKHESLDLNVTDADLKDVLQDILKEKGLIYKVKDEFIIIEKDKSAKPMQKEEQEKKELKGTITDEDGNTLPGVSVVIKGTTTGVATDIDGNYTIQFEKNNVVFVFSSVGMTPQEVNYKGQLVQNITLANDSEQMDEVVCTGYQTLSRERATGSFASIKNEMIADKISIDLVSRLEGLASGVQVDAKGNITIRGISTLNANKKPLIVVDGFPVETDISEINPDDVESIHVLKDAAAASIWGARASNGVIVINRKQGTNSKAKVTFNYDLTLKEKPRYDKAGFASAADVVNMELEGFKNGWYYKPTMNQSTPIPRVADVIFSSEGFKNASTTSLIGIDPYKYLGEASISKIEQFKKEDGIKEFEKYFSRLSISQSYNLSVSGGGNEHNYYVSGRYDDDKKSLVRSEDSRLILNARLNWKMSNMFSLSYGINYSNTKRSSPQSTAIANSEMDEPMFAYGKMLNENGVYNPFPKGIYQGIKDEFNEKNEYKNWNYNPLQDLRNSSDKENQSNVNLFASLKVNLNDNLKLKFNYNHTNGLSRKILFFGEDSYVARNAYNAYTGKDGSGMIVHSFPSGAIKEDTFSSNTSSLYSVNLNYDYNKDAHSLSILAGSEYRISNSIIETSAHLGYNSRALLEQSVNSRDLERGRVPTWNGTARVDSYMFRPFTTDREDRFLSVYMNMGYTYNDKYTLTMSGRLDDSNLFGADVSARILPLWSVGSAWTISKEDFFDSSWLTYLRAQLTLGYSGNIDKTTTPFIKALLFPDHLSSRLASEIENPGNPALKWETTRTINFALKFSLWNKLHAEIQYYDKHSDDLLGEKSLNPLRGYETIKSNVAKVRNQGVELDLSSHLFSLNQVEVGVHLNFSYNKNEVLEAKNSLRNFYEFFQPGRYHKKGRSINSGYVYKWAGLSKKGKPQLYDRDGQIVDRIDTDGSNVLANIDALEYAGTTVAPYNASLSPNIRYKGFNMNLLFVGKFGHVIKLPSIRHKDLGRKGNMISKEITKRWMKPGDETITDVPGLGSSPYSSNLDYFNNANIRVRSGNFISLRELAISYDFPKNSLWETARLTLQARNLWKWVENREGIDPETTNFAYQNISIPVARTISLGLRVNF